MLFKNGHSSPEARFLCLAMREPEEVPAPDLRAAAEAVGDWERLASLASQHGVCPWMLHTLSRAGLTELVPEPALAGMRARTRSKALDTMLLAQALEQALSALGGAGVPAILLKGPAIAERFYPDPSLRPYRDIDLLVPLEAHGRAFELCAGMGYEVSEDHGGVGSVARGTCESPFEIRFQHRETGTHLEVHYDHLQTGLRPQGMEGVWRRGESWSFSGIDTRVLALDDLFLFLCVHLNKHGFSGLIWFKDLDLILRRQGHRLDWPWLARTARREGVISSVGYTLRLLPKLLGTPLPAQARELARTAGGGLMHRLLWSEHEILGLGGGRWRRAVQFVPRDGIRGVLPSLLVMGRRSDRLRALGRRLLLE